MHNAYASAIFAVFFVVLPVKRGDDSSREPVEELLIYTVQGITVRDIKIGSFVMGIAVFISWDKLHSAILQEFICQCIVLT